MDAAAVAGFLLFLAVALDVATSPAFLLGAMELGVEWGKIWELEEETAMVGSARKKKEQGRRTRGRMQSKSKNTRPCPIYSNLQDITTVKK